MTSQRFVCSAALIAVVACLATAGILRAEESDGFVEMFNGKDFTGWDVLTCEAEVQADGSVLLKAGNGLVQTKEQYTDVVLDVEWKALKPDRWDSGIYFRYTEVPQGRPWPRRYQANMRKGMEGNVGLPGATSTGLIKPGEWNRFVLTVQGTTAALEINGKPAWKADGLEDPTGHIALQAEIPGGGQFLFRNVRIKDLSAEK